MLRRENAQLRVAIDQIIDRKAGPTNGPHLRNAESFAVLDFAFQQSERARGATQDELNQKFQQIIEQMNRGFEQVTKSSIHGGT